MRVTGAGLVIATAAETTGTVISLLTGFSVSGARDADATEADLVRVTGLGDISHSIGAADRDVGTALALTGAGSADRRGDTGPGFADLPIATGGDLIARTVGIAGFESVTVGASGFPTATNRAGIRLFLLVTIFVRVPQIFILIDRVTADVRGNPYVGLVLQGRVAPGTADEHKKCCEHDGEWELFHQREQPERHSETPGAPAGFTGERVTPHGTGRGCSGGDGKALGWRAAAFPSA